MNTIKVFLASSIKEFSKERQTLMAFFQTLNNIYHERGVFLEMIICESLSHQMQNVRAQEMYNRAILESEYFYVIIGNEAGEYTIEEFNIAYHSFREIYACRHDQTEHDGRALPRSARQGRHDF